MEIDHFRVASMNLTWIWQRQDHQEIDRHQVKHKRIENQHPQFIDRTIFSIIQNHVGQGQQKCQERKELNSRFNSRDIPHCVSFFRYKITLCTMTKGDFFIDIEYYTAR